MAMAGKTRLIAIRIGRIRRTLKEDLTVLPPVNRSLAAPRQRALRAL
jgi:hypothetical protein